MYNKKSISASTIKLGVCINERVNVLFYARIHDTRAPLEIKV